MRLSQSISRCTSRISGQAWAMSWCASSTGWACCMWVRPGIHGAAGLFALLDQGVDEVKQESGDYAGVTAQPHANQAGDLVVAGTAGPELAAEFIAGNVNQTAFEGGGLVLIVFDGGEGAIVNVALERVERILHALQLVGGQKSRTAREHGRGRGNRRCRRRPSAGRTAWTWTVGPIPATDQA